MKCDIWMPNTDLAPHNIELLFGYIGYILIFIFVDKFIDKLLSICWLCSEFQQIISENGTSFKSKLSKHFDRKCTYWKQPKNLRNNNKQKQTENYNNNNERRKKPKWKHKSSNVGWQTDHKQTKCYSKSHVKFIHFWKREYRIDINFIDDLGQNIASYTSLTLVNTF